MSLGKSKDRPRGNERSANHDSNENGIYFSHHERLINDRISNRS